MTAGPVPFGYPLAVTARRAFTLIELLVVIAIVAVLIAILMPSLGVARNQAKATVCGARLHQLGVATSLYLSDFNNALPQMRSQRPWGEECISAAAFGGKRGQVPVYGLNQLGAHTRPLNSYLDLPDNPADDSKGRQELEAFRSPCDKGAAQTYLGIEGFDKAESIYDMTGSSYVLNDHGLDGEAQATLIPAGGGAMPEVADPSRTWLLGSAPIYAFQQDSDRGQQWYTQHATEANLCFVDMHVRIKVPVPDVLCEVENTTRDYTFMPVPGRVRP